MPTPLIEICVDCAEGLNAAVAGGADRIELCAALSVGGLTPSPGMIAMAVDAGVPVFAMIRPREGDFVYDPADVAIMLRDISTVRQAGLAGVVFGANRPDGTLDIAVLRQLVAASGGLGITLHRAFDLTPDPMQALDDAIALGIPRILTSGGARTAIAGAPLLERLMDRAKGRISIMPGSGINAHTVHGLRHLPLREIHGSCATELSVAEGAVTLGFAAATRRRTDAAEVRALRAALGN